LCLVHVGAAIDAEVAGLLVELFAGASAWPWFAGTKAAAPAGGDVAGGRARAGFGFAAAGALLVDGARRDLLGTFERCALLALAVLDVSVLALALAAFFTPRGGISFTSDHLLSFHGRAQACLFWRVHLR
jgi:hypothetical protein